MVGNHRIFLYFVEFRSQNGCQRVLLTIDCSGFKCRVNFGERHRQGVGAEFFERVNEKRILDDTHFESGKILGLVDRPAAVGYLAKAVFPETQTDQVFLRKLFQELPAERAVQQGIGLLIIVQQEWQIDQPEFLQPSNADEGRGIRYGHFQCAALQGRDHGDVISQRAAVIEPHLHFSIALLRHDLTELRDGMSLGMIGR
jgi:hypothetical protein